MPLIARLLIFGLIPLLVACSGDPASPTDDTRPNPTLTGVANPTSTSVPTESTVAPQVPVETATSVPVPTSALVPTSTSTTDPTILPTVKSTVAPTSITIPSPTVSPELTSTPEPTSTATPSPTLAPQPTNTPEPTQTPEPTLSPYYTKIVDVKGVRIIANDAVDIAALTTAADIVNSMIGGRADISSCMADKSAALAIIPRDQYVTTIPEFSYLAGRIDGNGNPYDSFNIRGLGAVVGQPVSATSEENLLKLPEDRFWNEDITVHEFAHALMNLCWNDEDRAEWNEHFVAAGASGDFAGTFSQVNLDEFFAEMSQSYFGVNNEIGGQEAIAASSPSLLISLTEFYGVLGN